ncbi:hypothetical protein [Aquimarina rhabdastrellae]
MSGSSGGGYVPPQSNSFLDCETGKFSTYVSSIDIDVLKNLNIGDILEVELLSNKIILSNSNGENLGSIINQKNQNLEKCINQGFEFEAKIISIDSPACQVLINSKKL